MTHEDCLVYLSKKAKSYGIDDLLVISIAQVESNVNPLSVRYEPKWKYLLDVEKFAKKNNITADTETVLQSLSYGPMQIMGSVCRELFFQDTLVKLFHMPELAIDLSVKKLKMWLDKYGNIEDAIACWNGGNRKKYLINGLLQYSNQKYVDKVMSVYNDLNKTRSI